MKRTLSALQRGPIRFHRNKVVVAEGDLTDYFFFVIKGVIRSCKTFEDGARSIVAFYIPGDVFGWSDLTCSLSIEAATDTELLFVKRNAFLSIASREVRVANFLLAATSNKLRRAHGEKNFLALGWEPEDEIKRLKRSANWGRHAKGTFDPPPEPMPMKDGRNLLGRLIRRAFNEEKS